MATKKMAVQKKKVQKLSAPSKKAPQKATPPRKPAAKKSTPKKPAAKPAAKKSAPKKPAAKPAMNKKAAKTSPAAKAPSKAPARPAAPVVHEEALKAKPARPFSKEELAAFRTQLQQHLELVQDNLNALAGDNLKRSPQDATGDISSHSTHMADHGTDNFDRELALSLASSRQDSLYDIEDAIRRIDEGSYGACESCGGPIERPRLRALPFAKKCMTCQNAAERGRTKYRPFGGTLPLQQLASEDTGGDSPDSMG